MLLHIALVNNSLHIPQFNSCGKISELLWKPNTPAHPVCNGRLFVSILLCSHLSKIKLYAVCGAIWRPQRFSIETKSRLAYGESSNSWLHNAHTKSVFSAVAAFQVGYCDFSRRKTAEVGPICQFILLDAFVCVFLGKTSLNPSNFVLICATARPHYPGSITSISRAWHHGIRPKFCRSAAQLAKSSRLLDRLKYWVEFSHAC